MKTLLLTLSFLVTAQSFAQNAYDPTNDLNKIFGGKCKSNGALNATAYNESQGLINTLNEVAKDPNCHGLQGVLQQVSSLNINRALARPDSKINMETMVGEVANLNLAILQEEKRGSEADQEYITALKADMVKLHLQLSRETESSKVASKKARLETIQNVDAYADSLMTGLEQGDACLTGRNNIPAQIGAQVLGVASGLATGFASSLLFTAGKTVDRLIRYMERRGLNKDIKIIVDSNLGQALGCAFEGISQTFCQALDYDVLRKTNQDATVQDGSNPTWGKGLNTAAKGTAAYTEFVNQINGGSPKTTPGLVSDMQTAQSLRAQLDQKVTSKDYLVITGVADVKDETDPTAQANQFRKLLLEFADLITPSCGTTNMSGACLAYSGPFRNSFVEDPNCGPQIFVYTKGVERSKRVGTPNMSCGEYLKTINPQPTIADLPKMQEVMKNIFNEASDFVTKENSKVQQSSNIQVLASARLEVGGRTTLDYFKESDAYLESLLQDTTSIASDDPHEKKLIEETQKKIRTVVGLLERRAPNNEEEAAVTVAKISNELIPKGNKGAIPSALNTIVQLDVEQRIRKGSVDQNLATLMKMPKSGSISELLQIYEDPESAKQQTRKARESSRANLLGLASALNPSLKIQFDNLKKKSDMKDEDSRESLAILCLQTLTVPGAPAVGSIDLDQYCKGTTVKSDYANSNIQVEYDKVSKGDERTRMCSLHDYYRKTSLYGKKKDFQEKAKAAK